MTNYLISGCTDKAINPGGADLFINYMCAFVRPCPRADTTPPQEEGCKAAILAGWMATGPQTWKDDPSKGTVITANWLWMVSSVPVFCNIPETLCVWLRVEKKKKTPTTTSGQLYPWTQNSKQSQTSRGDKETNGFLAKLQGARRSLHPAQLVKRWIRSQQSTPGPSCNQHPHKHD